MIRKRWLNYVITALAAANNISISDEEKELVIALNKVIKIHIVDQCNQTITSDVFFEHE